MGESKKMNRREFLRNGAAAGVFAAAVPYFVPSSALGADGKPGANDRIRIAGIGVGRQGGGLIRAFQHFDSAEIVAVADVDMARAKKVADWVDAEPYQDYRRVLDRDDVDAIVTATPDHWRALVCIHACQAGKDIYAEKPMTLTIAEGRKMVQAVRKYNRVFQTGSQQRSLSANHKGCELIRNGRIGKVKKVIAHNYPSPWIYGMDGQEVPDHMDWETWCGPVGMVPYHKHLETPRAKPGWISFRRFSGGEMTGWGSHGFDQIQWALGMDDSGPIEVWTEGPEFDPPTYTEPEGRGRGEKVCSKPKVYMRYPGDIVMELGDAPPGGGVFIGEKGTITIGRGSLKSDPPELAKEPLKDKEVSLYKSRNHYKNWLNCIKERKKPVADVEIGHRSGTVCHLANLGRELGRKLKWDPEKEEFVGDSDANKHLDRERRKGYRLPDKV